MTQEMKWRDIQPGDFTRLGANYDGQGVNFALFSAHAERVELCLFDETGKTEIERITPSGIHERDLAWLHSRPEARCTLRLSSSWII